MNTQNQLMSPKERCQAVENWIMSNEVQVMVRRALPRHLDPMRVAQLVMVEARRIPGLTECTGESLLGAVMEVSKLGLELGTQGHAWILPYNNRKRKVKEATLIVGYRGMLDLAWRSDKIRGAYAHEVREGDRFDYQFGSCAEIDHKPAPYGDRGEITHAYAGVDIVGGGRVMDVMAIEEVEKIRARSRAKDSGPWSTDYPAMCCKTVMRKALKLAPASTELARAITLDELAETGNDQNLEQVVMTPDPANVNTCEQCGDDIDVESGEVEFYRYADGLRCVLCGRRPEET